MRKVAACGALVMALVLGLFPAAAMAQKGPSLVLTPWGEGGVAGERDVAEIGGGVRWFEGADVEDTGEDVALTRYDSRGRTRFDSGEGRDVLVGYDAFFLNVDSGDAALPERMLDAAVGVGLQFPQERHRTLSFVVGGGYAGTTPFSDADSLYLLGTAIYEMPLSEQSKLTFTLGYDGNRTIWPDLPLPAVAYTEKLSDDFTYTVGVPFSTLRWRPANRWLVALTYGAPVTVDVTVTYEIAERWEAFLSLDGDTEAVWLEEDEDRRLFFSQTRVETGVTYQPVRQMDVTIAGGWAFDQEFERGWDVRDLDSVREIDDALYVRAAVGLRF